MSAEKELSHEVETTEVVALLAMLLGNPDTDDSYAAERTLAEFGIDASGVLDLWAAVCVEFADCFLESEIEPGVLDPDMTVTVAAETMTNLLGLGSYGR